jgi:hypothetical protein
VTNCGRGRPHDPFRNSLDKGARGKESWKTITSFEQKAGDSNANAETRNTVQTWKKNGREQWITGKAVAGEGKEGRCVSGKCKGCHDGGGRRTRDRLPEHGLPHRAGVQNAGRPSRSSSLL